jgi:gamma-glutamyltranspeptidase
VPVSPGLGRAIQARIGVVRADPGLRSLLLDAVGKPLAEGATLVQPVLADTLEELAADWSSYYTGALAERLVAGLNALGSPLSAADFAGHRAELLAPLQREVNGVTWSVAPPPSQGAVLLAILDPASGDPVGTARAAELRRDALLGDPRTGQVDVEALLGRADPGADGWPTGPKPAGDTVAVTAVGDDGVAVTLIQSVFQSFGSGLLDPGTGVVFHNRGSAFSLDPAHPGRLRPGARPPHTLCPVIGVGPDLLIALGCQGGRAQAWILAQLAGDVGAAPDLDALLARPRWVIGSRDLGRPGPTLLLEPGVPGADGLIESATELGLEVVLAAGPQDDAGHVQVARLNQDGLAAGSDRRADGRAEIIVAASGAPAS